MIPPEFLAQWKCTCDQGIAAIDNNNDHAKVELAEYLANKFKALANHIAGVACPDCNGYGTKTYANTTGWRGGIGGQALTDDVCDKCWGTGRTDRSGPDLRSVARLVIQVHSARDNARILAHAYTTGNRPPPSVLDTSLSYSLGQIGDEQ